MQPDGLTIHIFHSDQPEVQPLLAKLARESFTLKSCQITNDPAPLTPEAAKVYLVDCNLGAKALENAMQAFLQGDPSKETLVFGFYFADKEGEQPLGPVQEVQSIYPIRRLFSIPFQETPLMEAIRGRALLEEKTRQRVLVIDDSPTQLALTIKSLSKYYNVITASTGQEGLRLSMMEEPDLILLDLNMPDTNGLKVCADLKSFYPTDQTPILVYTASGDQKLIQKALLVGATGFVEKKSDDAELIKKIEQFLK